MDIHIYLEKKYFYGILGMIILITSGVIIYASVDKSGAWHEANSIQITINGVQMTLQEAIERGLLSSNASTIQLIDGSNLQEFANLVNTYINTHSASSFSCDEGQSLGSFDLETGEYECVESGSSTSYESTYLYNNVHTEDACTGLGGEVINAPVKMCRFNQGTCPGGWVQYQEFSSTVSQSYGEISSSHCYCSNDNIVINGCGSVCQTSSHFWSNLQRESCSYEPTTCHKGLSYFSPTCSCDDNLIGYAKVIQIGCY